MKKLLLFILLISSVGVYGQSTKDITNSTDTPLDSAGVFQPTAWRNATGYNSITLSILSDQSSASSGVKIYWADKGVTTGVYRTIDSVTTTYTTGTIFKLTLPIIAPYLKVKYTNTTAAQTTFSFTTMLFVGQQFKFADEGGVIVDSVTVSGSALPTGASTSAGQDITNGHLTDIRGSDSTLVGYLHPVNKYGSAVSTVTTETDTILFSTLTVRGRWEVFSVNDTTEISLNGSFTESRIVYPYSTRGYDFDVTTSPKGYIRRYGGAGTASYESAHEGY